MKAVKNIIDKVLGRKEIIKIDEMKIDIPELPKFEFHIEPNGHLLESFNSISQGKGINIITKEEPHTPLYTHLINLPFNNSQVLHVEFNYHSQKQAQKPQELREPHEYWSKESCEPIPSFLHIQWFGSMLQEKYQERIKKWQQINPNWKIVIWFDDKFLTDSEKQQMQEFCEQNNLFLRTVRELQNEDNAIIFAFIDSLYQIGKDSTRVMNYGAISDLCRYLLLQEGGWHVETDVSPVKIEPDLKPHHGFFIDFNYQTSWALWFSPSVIGAIKNSPYCKVAKDIIIKILANDTNREFLLYALTDKKDRAYIFNTMASTGQIGRLACTKLTVNEKHLIFDSNTYKLNPNLTKEKFSLPYWVWSSEEIIASREKAWYDHEDIDFSYGQLGFKLPDYVENQLKQIDTMVEFALNQCQQVAAVDNQQNKRFKYV